MLKVYKECCKNCLLSEDSLVSPKRRKEIIQSCVKKQTHFICHTSEKILCKKYFDTLGQHSQTVRIAERLGMVEFIKQTNTDKLPSYKEVHNKVK